ncbi:MAG: hypothetical protein HQM08_29630 [Candidatus Riflebacteria bacterium]|nr:hypothetical protein [Candidatus Riflebacteria bacterium]
MTMRKQKKPEPQEPPPTSVSSTLIAFRIQADLLEKLERFIRKMKRDNPGLPITRASAIRMIVTKFLEKTDKIGQ